MGHRSRTTRELEHGTKRLLIITDAAARVLIVASKAGALSAIAICAYWSVDCLAGRSTASDIAVRFITDLKVNEWMAYVLAALFGMDAFFQRRMRRKKVGELTARLKKYELLVDPKRSSSMLAETGTTRAGDEL